MIFIRNSEGIMLTFDSCTAVENIKGNTEGLIGDKDRFVIYGLTVQEIINTANARGVPHTIIDAEWEVEEITPPVVKLKAPA